MLPRLLLVVCAWALVEPSWQQQTSAKSSCTFYDDQYTYNIELVKGPAIQNCESADTLNQKYKVTERRTLETSHEVMKLQGLVADLLTENQRLSSLTKELEVKVNAAQKALQAQSRAFETCPPGYTLRNDDTKSCYMFVGRGLAWYDAEIFCMSTNGHLVALESTEEQEFLVDYIKSDKVLPGHHLWTGGNDIAKEGEWMWAGINVQFNYTRWLVYPHPEEGQVEQPDNFGDKEHCVHMFHLHNYDWNDIYCGYKYYFICEAKLL